MADLVILQEQPFAEVEDLALDLWLTEYYFPPVSFIFDTDWDRDVSLNPALPFPPPPLPPVPAVLTSPILPSAA